jgi:(2Fe-2S) ferredoxin
MATIELVDASPVKYGDLTPDKARQIFKDHILGGNAAVEYAIGAGSEKGG